MGESNCDSHHKSLIFQNKAYLDILQFHKVLNIIYSYVCLSLFLSFPTTNNNNHWKNFGSSWPIFLDFYLNERKWLNLSRYHTIVLYSKTPPMWATGIGLHITYKTFPPYYVVSKLLPFTFINSVLRPWCDTQATTCC